MIYGFGARFGDIDVSGVFLGEGGQGMACVGWSEAQAPPLFDMLRNIGNGDLVFIKSYNQTVGLTIKAVGVVSDRTIRQFIILDEPRSGVTVRWVWRGNDQFGLTDDNYTPARNLTLYQEHSPEIQARVIHHLLAPGAGAIAPAGG
jgi:hypothetical protein